MTRGLNAAIWPFNRPQELVGATSWWFKSTRPHQLKTDVFHIDAVVAERQTHQLEGLAGATSWWFKSTRPHQSSEARLSGLT